MRSSTEKWHAKGKTLSSLPRIACLVLSDENQILMQISQALQITVLRLPIATQSPTL